MQKKGGIMENPRLEYYIIYYVEGAATKRNFRDKLEYRQPRRYLVTFKQRQLSQLEYG